MASRSNKRKRAQDRNAGKLTQEPKSGKTVGEESGEDFARENKIENRTQGIRLEELPQEDTVKEFVQKGSGEGSLRANSVGNSVREKHAPKSPQKNGRKQPEQGTEKKLTETLKNAGRAVAEKIGIVAEGLKKEWLGATRLTRLSLSVMAAAVLLFFLLFIVQSVRLSGTVKGKKSAEAMSKNLQEEIEELQERLLEQERKNTLAANTPGGTGAITEPTAKPSPTPELKTPTPTEVLPTTPVKRNYLVCVDAGHGGFDGGAVLREHGEEVRIESKDNLAIAKLFERALRERGIEVRMTRDDDTFLELEERTAIANAVKADLMISLHRNSYYDADGNSKDNVEGVEIWLHTSKPKNATILAERMLDAMEGVGISKNRGVKFGTMGDSKLNYAINRYAAMDSMIVELGFVTSTADNRNFDDYSADYANALAEVVEAWLKEFIPLE